MFFHSNFMLIYLYSVILKKNVTMMTFFNLESLSWPSAPCLIKQENVFYTLSGREKKNRMKLIMLFAPQIGNVRLCLQGLVKLPQRL